jgi:hypothetical protein
MMQLLLILTLFSVLLVPPPLISRGGAKPDFSGTWNATIVRPASKWSTGLKISYHDPELKITRIPVRQQPTLEIAGPSGEYVYYTDGRGEKQKQKSDSTKSKTERIGEKFVITSSSKEEVLLADVDLDVSKQDFGKSFLEMLVSPGLTTITGREVTLEVSSDGKALTETTTLTTRDGNRRSVRLYDRVAGINKPDVNGEWLERIGDTTISLTIEHHDPEIKVTRRVTSVAQDETEIYIYYSDGRGETNLRGGRRVKSDTKWKDNDLVITVRKSSGSGANLVDFTEWTKWQIAKDGGSLSEIIQWRSGTGMGGSTSDPKTLVYTRRSN